MPAFNLTNKSDVFVAETTPGFANGSTVSGGNGDDFIDARGNYSNVEVRGGNGNDRIYASEFRNAVYGENGDDYLFIQRFVGIADGGNGNDTLESWSSGLLIPGNTLTGGRGADKFILENTTTLLNTNDTDGVISDGDSFGGTFDTITDYASGESLDFGATTRVEDVAMVPRNEFSDEYLPVLGDGEYIVVRGDKTSENTFVVDSGGEDLFILYDKADGIDSTAHGVVALTSYTDASGLFVV